MYDSRRHDHLCQGRTFLDLTKRSPLEGKILCKFRSQSSSDITTEPASSSSSSDSGSPAPWEPSDETSREDDTKLEDTIFALSGQGGKWLKEVDVATTNDEDADPCAAVLRGWQRAWYKLMGQWTSRNAKVEYTRRNWASNISFKTFQSLRSDVDIVRRLGLVNDNNIICTTNITMFR